MTAQGISEEEMSLLLSKNDVGILYTQTNSPYLPRSKKKRKSQHLLQKLFHFWQM
ncbi:hypothetical protein GCM10008018_00900 [Paenibacillus marchantiophytorum]|uniref:Uncharacterized protein n=1 Tax=Paenibacillus marchantiophytorum TaxID=1619310 RepID=A0ABQ2BMK3_9BACL|nr:hypothetical protein GCM10008018_00900 [Paenibacillus marchantiophytorum]